MTLDYTTDTRLTCFVAIHFDGPVVDLRDSLNLYVVAVRVRETLTSQVLLKVFGDVLFEEVGILILRGMGVRVRMGVRVLYD